MWSIRADARFIADGIRRDPLEDDEHSLSPCPTAPGAPILPRSAARRARRVIPGRPGRTRSVVWW